MLKFWDDWWSCIPIDIRICLPNISTLITVIMYNPLAGSRLWLETICLLTFSHWNYLVNLNSLVKAFMNLFNDRIEIFMFIYSTFFVAALLFNISETLVHGNDMIICKYLFTFKDTRMQFGLIGIKRCIYSDSRCIHIASLWKQKWHAK